MGIREVEYRGRGKQMKTFDPRRPPFAFVFWLFDVTFWGRNSGDIIENPPPRASLQLVLQPLRSAHFPTRSDSPAPPYRATSATTGHSLVREWGYTGNGFSPEK